MSLSLQEKRKWGNYLRNLAFRLDTATCDIWSWHTRLNRGSPMSQRDVSLNLPLPYPWDLHDHPLES